MVYLEYFEHDVMKVRGHVRAADLLLGPGVDVGGVQGRGQHLGVLHVLPVAEGGGREVGVLAHTEDVALLIYRPHHPRHCLGGAQQGVIVRHQHVLLLFPFNSNMD